jgi:hypothetical protein
MGGVRGGVTELAKRIPVALAIYAVLAAMFLAGTASPIEAAGGGSAAYVSDQVIVRFADSVDAQAQADVNSRNGGQEVSDLGGIRAKVIRVAAGGVERAVRDYRADSRVLYAEPNYIVRAISPIRGPLSTIPGDPSFGQLWGLRNTGQTLACGSSCYGGATGTAGADIKAEPAWSVTTGNGTPSTRPATRSTTTTTAVTCPARSARPATTASVSSA